MTPNEICREIVSRLQLGGGVSECQPLTSNEWMVRTCDLSVWFNGSDLNDVAEAIRAVMKDKHRWAWQYKGGKIVAGIRYDTWQSEVIAEGETEAEALTRALHGYLQIAQIGEEHLQPPEPEEPWIDVSESVSTANLPRGRELCDLKVEKDTVVEGWAWNYQCSRWDKKGDWRKPGSLDGTVKEWRYAK